MKNILKIEGFAIATCALLFSLFFIQTSCKPEPVETVSKNETGTVTDREGNVYATVKIGNQWWMAEDLRVKSYLNGDTIAYHPASVDWIKDTAAYCKFSTSGDFGFLYNFLAVGDTRKLAPEGWHIPSDEEWKVLEMTLGMERASADSISWRGTKQGTKLKITQASSINSIKNWEIELSAKYTNWPTNESGFTALPAGCRIYDGKFGLGPKYTGFWWTSSLNNNDAWYRYLDYQKTNVFRFYADKHHGFSVRCVKD